MLRQAITHGVGSLLRQHAPASAKAFAARRTFAVDVQVIAMPALSPTMEVGTIAAWRQEEGEQRAEQVDAGETGARLAIEHGPGAHTQDQQLERE